MNHNSTTPSVILNDQLVSSAESPLTHVSVIPLPPPPSYAEASQASSVIPLGSCTNLHPFEISHRFPSGLFVLRNRSSLKILDVSGARTSAGTPIIAYSAKRPTLVNGDLFHKANNQLFFLDWHGCLCSASSGLRVDVEDYKLILSKPQPITIKPTRDSHPPVQFKYDPVTRTISVVFLHDPTYTESNLKQVNSVDYLLEVQPQSSSSGSPSGSNTSFPLEKISEWLTLGKSITPLSSQLDPTPPSTNYNDSEDPDLDDSINPARQVHVISIAPGWREKFPTSGSPEARKWLKRQWDIASIVVQPIDPPPASDSRHLSTSNNSSSDPDGPQGFLADVSEVLGDLRDDILRTLKGSSST